MVVLLIKHAMLVVVAFSWRGASGFQWRRFRRLANPRYFYYAFVLLGKANFSIQVVFLNPTMRSVLKIRGLIVFFLFLTRTICENREKVQETRIFVMVIFGILIRQTNDLYQNIEYTLFISYKWNRWGISKHM